MGCDASESGALQLHILTFCDLWSKSKIGCNPQGQDLLTLLQEPLLV